MEDIGKGKWIEYNCYNDKVIFEGEYLNGQRNGKAKEYFDNGKLNLKENIQKEKEYMEGNLKNGLYNLSR